MAKSPPRGKAARSRSSRIASPLPTPPSVSTPGREEFQIPPGRLGVADLEASPELRELILEALAATARLDDICYQLNIGRQTLYRYRDRDPEFKKLWDEAIEAGNDALEDEAVRRAKDGTLKPVYQGGILVGHVREYSDSLMQFLLKGRRREKFGDKSSVEHSGPNGGPIAQAVLDIPADLSGLTDDQLAKLYREAVDPPK